MTTATASTWQHKVAARAAELGEPLAAVLEMTPYQRQYCGRLDACALESILRSHGWRSVLVSSTQENYDRVPGGPGLSSTSAGTSDWYHADHPGFVIRVTDGVNHRAGTSWGGVRLLEGDDLAAATENIAAREADRKRHESERARLAALPEGAFPGVPDHEVSDVDAAAAQVKVLLWQACDASSVGYCSAALDAEWEAARTVLWAAKVAIERVHQHTQAAMQARRTAHDAAGNGGTGERP